MTKEEYLEYWNSMSHSELMVRAGLYIDRIAELEAEVKRLQPIVDLTKQWYGFRTAPSIPLQSDVDDFYSLMLKMEAAVEAYLKVQNDRES